MRSVYTCITCFVNVWQVCYAELSDEEIDGSNLHPPKPKKRIIRSDDEDVAGEETDTDVAVIDFEPDNSPVEDVPITSLVPQRVEELFEEAPPLADITQPEPYWELLFANLGVEDFTIDECQVG